MNKIYFHSSKSKFKKFQDDIQETKKSEKVPAQAVEIKIKSISPEKKVYKNKNQVFADLSDQLVNRYNIDSVSVYLLLRQEKGRLSFKKLYGQEISEYILEKYFGYNCPMICTNAGGMIDNISHRARLVEHIGNYMIIVSSSAYEVYRNKYDLEEIRRVVENAFTEVEKFK